MALVHRNEHVILAGCVMRDKRWSLVLRLVRQLRLPAKTCLERLKGLPSISPDGSSLSN
jgi:hypothetical protein